jgi:hypothetical protein
MKKDKLEKQLSAAASNEFIRSMVLAYAERNPALTVVFN